MNNLKIAVLGSILYGLPTLLLAPAIVHAAPSSQCSISLPAQPDTAESTCTSGSCVMAAKAIAKASHRKRNVRATKKSGSSLISSLFHVPLRKPVSNPNTDCNAAYSSNPSLLSTCLDGAILACRRGCGAPLCGSAAGSAARACVVGCQAVCGTGTSAC